MMTKCCSAVVLAAIVLATACSSAESAARPRAVQKRAASLTTAADPDHPGASIESERDENEGISYEEPMRGEPQVADAAHAQAAVKFATMLPTDFVPTSVFVRAGGDPLSEAVVYTRVASDERFVILEIPADLDEATLEKRQNMDEGTGSHIKSSALVELADGKRVVTFDGDVTVGADFLIGDTEVRIYGNAGDFTSDAALKLASEKWIPVG